MLFGLLGKKSTYVPKWFSFNRTVDTKPYVFRIDTGHHDLYEQKEYRNILVLSFVSQHPDVQGMPSAEEQAMVSKVSEKVWAVLQSATPTFFLGTVCGGRTLFLYYAALQPVDGTGLTEALASIPLAHTATWADDSRWSFIKDTIYPTDKELQRITNITVLEVVKVEQGKSVDVPPPHGIAHTIFLKGHEDGMHIAEDLKASGYYQVGNIETIKKPGDSPYLYVMELGKDEPLSIESVNSQTDAVIDTIKKYNAQYDGWRAIQSAPIAA